LPRLNIQKSNDVINHSVRSNSYKLPELTNRAIDSIELDYYPWYKSTLGLSRPDSPLEIHQTKYNSFINESIDESMLVKFTNQTFLNILIKVNRPKLMTNKYEAQLKELRTEIENFYTWSLKKSIFDYLLKDEEEKERLSLRVVKKVFSFLVFF
jgi:hypothetical protein